MPAPDRLRVAAVQYFIRPVSSFDEFAEQVRSAVASAVEYGVHAVLLPEYFSTELVALEAPDRSPRELLRGLARHADATVELLAELARRHGVYLVGGGVPTPDPADPDVVYNDCPVVSPDGRIASQGKLHVTPWEAEHSGVTPRDRLKVFDTAIGRFAVNICYDVEFPELARAAGRAGCELLFCPTCTDDRQSFLRVRYCAHARAIENQMYVVQAVTVGALPKVPSVSLLYGQAGLLTPSDFGFARDGVLAEGEVNEPMVVVGEFDMALIEQTRREGTVLPLRDSTASDRVAAAMDTVVL